MISLTTKKPLALFFEFPGLPGNDPFSFFTQRKCKQ